jgi:acetate kinase
MKVLVANLGSTSFKYRLFDLGEAGEPVLARGSIDRIGSGAPSTVVVKTFRGERTTSEMVGDHAIAVERCLSQLTDPEIGVAQSAGEVAAIGFKAVHACGLSGVQVVDERVISAMEEYAKVAPAHNPPYTRAMRILRERFPSLPLVAAFETGFHASIQDRLRRYAIPEEWSELGITRYGFHGASHRYIAERITQVTGLSSIRVISCHLGGSSSIAAIRDGRSVACSLGFSPQTGLPHNNRVGDFDVFAIPVIMAKTGLELDGVLDTLANRSGLFGISGGLNDLRDIEAAAEAGNARATLALDVFVTAIRHALGAYLIELGGADAIVFTGGIGENSSRLRSRVCDGLEWLGIELDPERNRSASGEALISADSSATQLWTIPANEELIVARQTREALRGREASTQTHGAPPARPMI